MAHTQSAKYWLRKSAKNRAFNLEWKGKFKDLLKKSRKAIAAKQLDEAHKLVAETCKVLDKTTQKKVIKKNKAARLKSRLMAQFNKAQKLRV